MKCIKFVGKYNSFNDEVRRVSDTEAAAIVNAPSVFNDGRWQYCPKHEWKAAR